MNKNIYEIDLHGVNMAHSKIILDEFFENAKRYKKIWKEAHIVVGVGNRSEHGPVLPSFVMNYLEEKGVTASLKEGVIKVIL